MIELRHDPCPAASLAITRDHDLWLQWQPVNARIDAILDALTFGIARDGSKKGHA